MQIPKEAVIGNMSTQKNSEMRKKNIPKDSLGDEKKRKCLKIK